MPGHRNNIEKALNLVRTNFHDICNISDIEIERKQKQAFYYLNLLKLPRKIIDDQRALDALNFTYKNSTTTQYRMQIPAELLADLSIEYNFPEIAVNLIKMLKNEIQVILTKRIDIIAEIFLKNHLNVMWIIIETVKVFTKDSLSFCEAFFGSNNGEILILNFLDSEILSRAYIEQADSEIHDRLNHIFEAILYVLLNRQMNYQCSPDKVSYDSNTIIQILEKFYKNISARIEQETAFLIFNLLFSGKLMEPDGDERSK